MGKSLCLTLWVNSCFLSRNEQKVHCKAVVGANSQSRGLGSPHLPWGSPAEFPISALLPHFLKLQPKVLFHFTCPETIQALQKVTFCWIQNWNFAAQALGQSEKKKSQKTKIQTTLLFLGLAGKQRTTFVTFQRGCEDQNSSVSLDRCHWKLCKPGQSCGTAPGTPLAPEQRAEQRWWFYRLKFSCQSTHNYLQPWGWGCECKTKLTKYHLKPFKRVESLFTHSCLPSFLYHP